MTRESGFTVITLLLITSFARIILRPPASANSFVPSATLARPILAINAPYKIISCKLSRRQGFAETQQVRLTPWNVCSFEQGAPSTGAASISLGSM
jgi:hypothetical protein